MTTTRRRIERSAVIHSSFVTLSRKELTRMSLDDIKAFARRIGMDLNRCETLNEAHSVLLSSAVEFTNLT